MPLEKPDSSFHTGWDFWEFCKSVRQNFRFAHEDHVRDFLRTLVSTSVHRRRTIKPRTILWRAQLGSEDRTKELEENGTLFMVPDTVPLRRDRMSPLPGAASEGRANPKGIPVLYLATDKETAMSEVRPWVGATLSVAQFEIERELTVIDFSIGHGTSPSFDLYFADITSAQMEEEIWREVDRAFSQPITDDASTAGYVPTQVIAEAFRRKGLDGVVYKSLLGDGFNVALFDLQSATLQNCTLFQTEKVSFAFREEGQTYYRRTDLATP